MNLLLSLLLAQTAFGPQIDATKRFPAPGIAPPEAIRVDLKQRLANLQVELARIKPLDDHQLEMLPDAEIYEKAVRYALEHNEFYRTNEFVIARQLLAEGQRRADALAKHDFPWTSATGLVVRAYRSRLDGSVQPYGLVVPKDYRPMAGKRYRLDVWLHGRDETLTELKFIQGRSTNPGEFTPPDTFVLHPYGRYCNGFKFAGELDVLEAVEAVQQFYPIDSTRIALRGFSMGGAGVWHLAAHYADRWVCAAPGAGFAETALYLRLNPASVPSYERKLWQWYDATGYALNLFNTPVVAYSGQLDKQRQAADVMAAALAREGLPLIHLIGPNVEHKYEPETKKVLSSIVDTMARIGGTEVPREVRLTTRTLRYPKMHWLVLLGLDKHWERADAWAQLDQNRVTLSVTNVSVLALDFRSGPTLIRELEINGAKLKVPGTRGTNFLILTKSQQSWAITDWPTKLAKRPGLQGPIDDAFMDSFLFVLPSGGGFHDKTSHWIAQEVERARYEWRAQFRGEVQIRKDSEVTEGEIRNSNLILWGDPQNNALLKRIMPKLPLTWSADRITLGQAQVDAKDHVPVMIYPNPLNPERYVVLNSCFTFRGFGSNASQTPKLPDYALLDLNKPDPFRGEIAHAGFFNENWLLTEH